MNMTGKLVTMDKEKAELLRNFFCVSSHTSQVDRAQSRDWRSKALLTFREEQGVYQD